MRLVPLFAQRLAEARIPTVSLNEAPLLSKSKRLVECQRKEFVFVCDPFSGEEFDLLLALKCRFAVCMLSPCRSAA